jgi:DNA segregation ATPase FtsK/SpoIIIE, S-DNA-T family
MPRRKSSALPKLKLRQSTVVTVGSIVAFILAGLSAVSLVFTDSANLTFWREFIEQTFGWTAYFTPFVFATVGLVLQKLKWQIAQLNVLIGLLTIMISLSALTAPISEVQAGLMGVIIWTQIMSVITSAGAALLLLGIVMVGIVVLFNTSLTQIFSMLGSALHFLKERIWDPVFNRPKQPSFATNRTAPLKMTGVDERPVAPIAPKAATAAVPTAPGGKAPLAADDMVKNVTGGTMVWKYPPLSLLSEKNGASADRGDVKKQASIIERTLDSFGIQARVAEVNGGPAVTQYALDISAGTKIAKIANLQHDIALALATPTGTVRVEAPIPGKSLVGIEVPNRGLEVVGLKSVLSSDEMTKNKSKLAVALGRDTASKPMIVDISRMPHVLVAGTTGSGKSSLMNSFITSLLFRNSPDELKLILIDPKRVEFTGYNDIPHLLTPVITEQDKILSALKWAMSEMDRRYKLFQSVGVRNVQAYNEMSGFQAVSNIVIFIDELADLMMFAPVEVEDAITRLAQLARATGIHLVIATQRPSVDVITGLMKANIPCRIAFNVSSLIDSRVILDSPGAEKLLGRGDMLFMPPDASKPMRIQGVYVQDSEINSLIKYIKDQSGGPQYTEEVTQMPIGKVGGKGGGVGMDSGDGRDDLFEEAVKTVCQYDKASASLLQRRLRVGYARAARLMDELEEAGIIGPGEGSKPRDVMIRNVDEYFQNQAAAAGSGGDVQSV